MENDLNDEDNKLLQINDPSENTDFQQNRESKAEKKKKIANANVNYANSNFLSRLFFFWLRHAVLRANKGTLDSEDVSQVSEEQSLNYSIDKIKKTFQKYNNIEKYKNNALLLTIVIHNWKLFLLLIILDLIDEGLDYVRIFFYGKIIELFSSGEFYPDRSDIGSIFSYITKLDEYPYNILESVILFIGVKFIKSVVYAHVEYNNTILIARISNQMVGILTEKILTSNTFNWLSQGEGELLNLAEVDADRIGNIFFSGPKIITSPIKVIVSMTLLYRIFGFYFFYVIIIIIIVMVFVVLVQIYYIKNMNILLMFKDARMKVVAYVFQTLKPLKLNGLEDEFIQRIKVKRDDEIRLTKKTKTIDIVTLLINNNLAMILIIFCLCFFAFSGKELDLNTLYTSLQLIGSMTGPLMLIPFFFNRLFSNLLSVKRLQAFLQTSDFDANVFRNIDKDQQDLLIKFNNVSFGLQNVPQEKPEDKEEGNPQNNLEENKPKEGEEGPVLADLILLKNITLTVKKGEFVAIVGPIGSGKSCLINAILSNYHIFSQDENPIINGEISFCPQQPWITTNTIKHNIIFHNKYDPVKYQKIISSCQLVNDFANLVDGDETIINSSSTNVSGGQKARIALARCLYKEADLYLFDDPFSSIDNKVKNLLFNELFTGYLKDKGKVLVTNDVTKCQNADKIVLLEKGAIKFTGTYEEYLQKYGSEENEEAQLDNSEQINTEKKEEENENNLMTEEEEEEAIEKNPYINKYFHSNKGNGVSCKTYGDFITYQGGYIITLILVILIVVYCVLDTYSNTFLSTLAEGIEEVDYDENGTEIIVTDGSGKNLRRGLPTFIKIIFLGIVLFFVTQYIILYLSITSIKKLHEEMVYKLAKAPINLFHDIVPIGQIINHLTKDIEIVQNIIQQVNLYINLIMTLISSLVLCFTYNKSTLYFSPIMILVTIFLTKYYVNTGRCLKRIQRIAYSPIMTILNESIKGVDIIRSCHAEKPTVETMYKKLDIFYAINLHVEGCQRWYDLWSSIFVQLFFCGMLFYMVYYSQNYPPEAAAIILSTTEDFLSQIIESTSYLSQLEISMIGLERCLTLLKVNSEKVPEKDITKDLKQKHWPNRGKIEIKDFSCRYRPETPIILKNVNLTINPGEKVGIVGRTGSGKSSLIISLARIIEPLTGAIYIDGVDIQTVKLEFLRNQLSVIAQDAFLIDSTIRDNIDPLNEHTDEEILKILDDFCLFPKMGNEKLEIVITENGKNMSLGEKQLIAFARTALKKNKIVILDEATSSMDFETEKIIQKNMQKYFADSTVLMIAHHLNMVKDCQTIVVVDTGEIVETGSYADLMGDKNSIFYSLNVQQTASS